MNRSREKNIRQAGRESRQNNRFVYVGGAACSDGRSDVEMRRMVQVEAGGRFMGDRHDTGLSVWPGIIRRM